jgi:hypothetical protein
MTVAVGADHVIDLPGERSLVVRPATDADVDGILALDEGLGPDDRYRRFFSYFRPDRAFVARLVDRCAHGGDELVVELRPAGRIVADAGWSPLPDGDGELAIVIDREWRGWLGPHLLDTLLRRAAAAGVANLRADVLAMNTAMLRVLRARGWVTVPDDDWSVVRLVVATEGQTPRWSTTRTRPRVVVEAAGGRWPAGSAVRKAGFDVLACPGAGGTTRCPVLDGERCPLVDGADVVITAATSDRWAPVLAARRALHPDAVEVADGPAAAVVERLRAATPGR